MDRFAYTRGFFLTASDGHTTYAAHTGMSILWPNIQSTERPLFPLATVTRGALETLTAHATFSVAGSVLLSIMLVQSSGVRPGTYTHLCSPETDRDDFHAEFQCRAGPNAISGNISPAAFEATV